MTRTRSCEHEDEILDVVCRGLWPASVPASLAAHAASCDVCRDLALVALSLQRDAETARTRIRVPDASVVWLRSAAMARAEAARRASQPMIVAHIWALGVLAVLAGSGVASWRLALVRGGAAEVLSGWWASITGHVALAWDAAEGVAASAWLSLSGAFPWVSLAAAGLAVVLITAWALAAWADRALPADRLRRRV